MINEPLMLQASEVARRLGLQKGRLLYYYKTGVVPGIRSNKIVLIDPEVALAKLNAIGYFNADRVELRKRLTEEQQGRIEKLKAGIARAKAEKAAKAAEAAAKASKTA